MVRDILMSIRIYSRIVIYLKIKNSDIKSIYMDRIIKNIKEKLVFF